MKEAFQGATVTDIAAKIGENYHTVRNWLKLKRDAPPQFFVAVAKLTNYSPYWLLTNEGQKLLPPAFSLSKKRVQPPTELPAPIRAAIRREIVSVLNSFSLSDQDRELAESLIKDSKLGEEEK